MLRFFKRLCWAGLLIADLQTAWGFALIGPAGTLGDNWQVPDIGYNPLPNASAVFPDSGDPLAIGPNNLGEEYRRNTPIIYYSCDQNFRQYFGSNGVAAVDQAFNVVNGLTNVSQYSTSLSEIPLISRRENYTAEALYLTDLKSFTLHFLTEQLGLTEPERYVWTLRERIHVGTPPCPSGQEYLVIQRNFDPVVSPLNQFQSSSYVNGALYSYFVEEDCGVSPPAPPSADAIEVPVDPLAFAYTAVASGISAGLTAGRLNGMSPGFFFNGLTRDDVGGLRYLLSTNNVNLESAGAGTEAFVTNNTSPQILVTSNLNVFISQAQTNNAATLQGLYPGLVVTSSSNYWGLLVTTNVTAVFTNSPYAPAGNTYLLLVTNYTTNVVQFFHHTFLNVITNELDNSGFVTVQTISTGSSPNGPAGGAATPITNETTTVTSGIFGDFYVVPTNLCGIDIITNLLPTLVAITNTITTTNAATTGTTNIQSFTENIITYYTNHTIVYYPVTCPTNLVMDFQGINRVRFVHVDDDNVDPLTGQYYTPFTNDYTLVAFNPTNHSLMPIRIRRIVTQPDILFSAQDLNGPANANGTTFQFGTMGRNVPFNTANVLPGLAGPGTLDSTLTNTVMVYNKIGPLYESIAPNAYFLQTAELDQVPVFFWGSFDGSTNAPVVYPNGTSIQSLEDHLAIQPSIPPPTLPDATNGVAYSVQLTANGAEAPYSWSLAPTSPGLPTGLTLSPDGLVSGVPVLQGSALQTGATFDFVIRLTDAGNRVVDWNYSITVNP